MTARFTTTLFHSKTYRTALALVAGLFLLQSTAEAQLTVMASDMSICLGDTTMLTATSSDSAYVWSPNVSLSSDTGSTVMAYPTATTTYTVIGFAAGGGSDTAMITITVNPIPTITLSTSADGDNRTVCLGNTVTMTVTPTTGLNYAWSPGATLNTTTGPMVTATPTQDIDYTLMSTDTTTGCTRVSTVSIAVNSVFPNLATSVDDPLICQGDTTELNASSDQFPTTYSWSPASSVDPDDGVTVRAFPSATTTYTVTGRYNGCESTAQVTIDVNPEPAMSITKATNDPICLDETNTVTVTAPTVETFRWLLQGGVLTTTSNVREVSPDENFTVTVIGTDANGCTNEVSILILVDPTCGTPSSVNDLALEGAIKAFVNGANALVLELGEALTGKLQVAVYDLKGAQLHGEVINKLPGTQISTINMEGYGAGTYLLNITSENGVYQRKLVKR